MMANNIPQLRFSEFESDDIIITQLNHILESMIDCEHKTAPYVEKSEFRVVRTNNVKNGRLLGKELLYTTEDGFDEWTKRSIPQEGEILFTREAPAGESALVPRDLNVCLGQRMVLLKPKKSEIVGQYLFHYLQTGQANKSIHKYILGTTVTRINIADIKKIKINITTSLTEQTKIAKFLTAVDKRIKLLQKKKTELEHYKKGVMQAVFSGQWLVVSGERKFISPKLRFKPEIVVSDEGLVVSEDELNTNNSQLITKNYPDWEEKMLGEVCEINPNTGRLPDTFIYIDLESVNRGYLIKERKISKENAPSRAQRVLQKGDIIYQTVRPYQKNNFFFDNNGDYVASTGYAQIRTNQDEKFLFQYIHTEKFVNKVLKRCTGTSYPAIGSSDLKTISISIPLLKEQQKIANFLSTIDKSIENISNQIEDSVVFKKGLLQKMFV